MSDDPPVFANTLADLARREARTLEAATRTTGWRGAGACALSQDLPFGAGRTTVAVWNSTQRMHDVLILSRVGAQRLLMGRSIFGTWLITAAPVDLMDPDWRPGANDTALAWLHSADSALSGLHRPLLRQDLRRLCAASGSPMEVGAVGRLVQFLLQLAQDTSLQDTLDQLPAPSPCVWAWLAPPQRRERRLRALGLEPTALWKALQVVGKACPSDTAEMGLAVRLLVAADLGDPLRPLAMALTGLSREQIRWANRVPAEASLLDKDRRDALTVLPLVNPAHRPQDEAQLRGILPWARVVASDWRLLFSGVAAAGLSPSVLRTNAWTFRAQCRRPFLPAPPPLPDCVGEWLAGLPTPALQAQAHAAVAGLTPRHRGDAAARLRMQLDLPWDESPDGCAVLERVASSVWRRAGLSESTSHVTSSIPVPWDLNGSPPVVPGFKLFFPRTADELVGVGRRMLNCLQSEALAFRSGLMHGQKLLILIEPQGRSAHAATLASLDLGLDGCRVIAAVDQHYARRNTPVPRANALALALVRRSIRRWFWRDDNQQRWKQCADRIDHEMSLHAARAAQRQQRRRQQLCGQLLLPVAPGANSPACELKPRQAWLDDFLAQLPSRLTDKHA